MAKKATSENGQDRLNEAMMMLIQNQAAFLGQLAQIEQATSERFARIDERLARIDERLARMEQDMTSMVRVLAEHSRLLERLPEAVRDKIGFKG